MEIRLEIFNFQSISHGVFTFDQFTTMTGQNNAGKSAVFRALKAALLNDFPPGEHKEQGGPGFIRTGAKECALHVTFTGVEHDVAEVERVRSKSKNSCTVTMRDGSVKTYPKAGKDNAPELIALGFEDVRTENKETHDLIFQEQLDALFLVSLSEPQLTSFLNKIFQIERWERVSRLLTADAKTLRSQYDSRADEIIQLGNDIEDVEDKQRKTEIERAEISRLLEIFDADLSEAAELDRAHRLLKQAELYRAEALDLSTKGTLMRSTGEALRAVSAQIEDLVSSLSLSAELRQAEMERASAEARLRFLRSLTPSIEGVGTGLEALLSASSLMLSHEARVDEREHLRFLSDRYSCLIPAIAELSVNLADGLDLQKKTNECRTAQSQAEGSRLRGEWLLSMKEPLHELATDLNDYLSIIASKRALNETRAESCRLSQSGRVLVSSLDNLRKVESYIVEYVDFTRLKSQIERAAADQLSLTNQHARIMSLRPYIVEQENLVREQLGTCPTCGEIMKAAHEHPIAA